MFEVSIRLSNPKGARWYELGAAACGFIKQNVSAKLDRLLYGRRYSTDYLSWPERLSRFFFTKKRGEWKMCLLADYKTLLLYSVLQRVSDSRIWETKNFWSLQTDIKRL